MQQHDDGAFEALAVAAGVPDLPVEVAPLAVSDVMRPTSTGLSVEAAAGDLGVAAWAYGYGSAFVDCGDRGWRSVVVMCVAGGADLTEIFNAGPGRMLETLWWSRSGMGRGLPVLCCTVSTADTPVAPPRRFTIRVLALREFVEAFSGREMIGLSLTAGDANDVDEDTMAWFIDNDRDRWASVRSRVSPDGRRGP